ncbi:VanW family protein, partial [Candidatus Fermentibacterales bacterium]|nr:VanW family protein [Candidatus Fermentibacterales bacterium]
MSRAATRARPLSSRGRLLFAVVVTLRRAGRRLHWWFDGRSYSGRRSPEALPHLVLQHRSRLIRRLGSTDITYQHNKVLNLGIACESLSGILIRPGEVFSFCRAVGKPSGRRGFVPGLELSSGQASTGVGGGLCALSNLIHWMVLHSDLCVTERHRHGFDPFPDDGRTLPFACGATIYYNYKDLQITNGTERTYQILA